MNGQNTEDRGVSTGLMGIGQLSQPHQQRNYHIEVKQINNGWIVNCGSEVIFVEDFGDVASALVELHTIFHEVRINNIEQFNKMKEANKS